MSPRCRKCGASDWVSGSSVPDDNGRCRLCRSFPTLGYEIGDWIEDRCAVPDRDQVGEPYILTPEQWRFLLNFYRVNPFAHQNERGSWQASFHYVRGGQLTRPQKWGKGPFLGAIISAEAAGPVTFDGWDADGLPVGRPWATPIIQIAASSGDQTDNVWQALLPMIALGDFGAEIPDTGLARIYLPQGGWIEPVSSSSKSRLGARITFLGQDQTESWTESNGGRALADTMRRGIAGMGGRWLSTCNAWDPGEGSVAQWTAEVEALEGDVYHDDVEPPAHLSVRNKTECLKALKHVYGDSWWVDRDRIYSEIRSMVKRDPAQAERWFLNRKSAAESVAFQADLLYTPDNRDFNPERSRVELELKEPKKGARIVLFADGALYADSLAIVGTDVNTGFQWPLGIWERPEWADEDYEHPLDEVDGVVREAFRHWSVWQMGVDPQYIEGLVENWQGEFGEKRVVKWTTNRYRQIAHAVRRYTEDLAAGTVRLARDDLFLQHMRQAHKQKVNVYDEKHVQMHTIAKDRPDSVRKMDAAMAAVGSWEFRGYCIAKGKNRKGRARGFA